MSTRSSSRLKLLNPSHKNVKIAADFDLFKSMIVSAGQQAALSMSPQLFSSHFVYLSYRGFHPESLVAVCVEAADDAARPHRFVPDDV